MKRLSLAALALALVAPVGLALNAAGRADDPSECPYCENDAATMQAAGLASHGGCAFAKTDTAGVDALLPDLAIRWIETPHFEIGFALGSIKVRQKERKFVAAELERLAEVLPEVDPKTKTLDPWLRLHLYAQRLEELYAKMLGILRVEQSFFPDGTKVWMRGEPFHGDGPHLGQKGKYEVLIVPSAEDQVVFLRDQFGLTLEQSQKWNVRETDSLILTVNLTADDIRGIQHLHNHVVFNVVHNLVDGFKHYSYDTPLYLKEGLAHWMERELDPDYNTYSFSEGGLAEKVTKKDWDDAFAKLVKAEEAPRLVELVALEGFAEWEPQHHLASWSLTAFFLERYPEEYAQLLHALHGRMSEDGTPDGSNMRDVHRAAMKEAFGKSYAQLDREWNEWALER